MPFVCGEAEVGPKTLIPPTGGGHCSWELGIGQKKIWELGKQAKESGKLGIEFLWELGIQVLKTGNLGIQVVKTGNLGIEFLWELGIKFFLGISYYIDKEYIKNAIFIGKIKIFRRFAPCL